MNVNLRDWPLIPGGHPDDKDIGRFYHSALNHIERLLVHANASILHDFLLAFSKLDEPISLERRPRFIRPQSSTVIVTACSFEIDSIKHQTQPLLQLITMLFGETVAPSQHTLWNVSHLYSQLDPTNPTTNPSSYCRCLSKAADATFPCGRC